MGTRAHIAAHEYVHSAFDEVLNALRTNPVLLGAEATERGECLDFARHGSRGIASMPVRVDDAEATLLVVRVVGGRQEPVTELALTARAVNGTQLPASAAGRFLETLVLSLEDRLRATSAEQRESVGPPIAWRGRPRILIESRDVVAGLAAETTLQTAGYDTALCGGPGAVPRHRCPLVTEGACNLAEEADVIVHALDLDRPNDAEILRAIRAHHPATPIVVQAAASVRARHQELLAGCSVVETMSRSALLGAVDAALGQRRGTRVAK